MKKLFALAAVLFCLGNQVFAGRPLTIDDADPVEQGMFEFEAGTLFEHSPDCKHWDFPFGLAYGVIPGLEAGIGFGSQLEKRTKVLENGIIHHSNEDSIGDLVIGAKWQFIESCPIGARHALMTSIKLPTADDDKELGTGKTDHDVMWIASRTIGERIGTHFNLGYSWIGGSGENVVHYGIVMDYQIADSIQWVGEVFAEKEVTGETSTVVQYNTGFRWNPTETLILDIAAGSNIHGNAPDFVATTGLTWTFGSKKEKNGNR